MKVFDGKGIVGRSGMEAEMSLLATLAEADRGETIGGNEFLNKLRKRL
jgi:hypothetical protein